MKRCTSCEQDLPREAFHKQRKAKDGLNWICAECNKAKVRAWTAANKERAAASSKAYREANADALKDRQQAYYAENRVAIIARNREWAVENRDRTRAANRRYEAANKAVLREKRRERRRRNPEVARERLRRWKAANPHKVRLDNFKRRFRHYDPDAVEYVKILLDDPCVYCGAPCEHIDHIVPLDGGGDNSWDNLTSACATCNMSKRTRNLLHHLLDEGRAMGMAA